MADSSSPSRVRKKSPSPRGSVVKYDGANYSIGQKILTVGADVVVNPGKGGRTNHVNGWLATLITDEYRNQFKKSTCEDKRAMLSSIYQMVLDKGGNFVNADGQVALKDEAVKYIRKMIVGKATDKNEPLNEGENGFEALCGMVADDPHYADMISLLGQIPTLLARSLNMVMG